MAALALTVLLALFWVAFVGFGYWHGGWRQVVLLAAMLLSYAVLSEWAAPNGHDLSTRFHWSAMRTTTGIALLYLLSGTFLLGFLGSFGLYRPRPLGPMERRLGAAVGILNGGLLLALVLRTLRSYAFVAGRGQALHRSPLSRFLIEDVGYLLLAALVLGGIAAVVGLVLARRDDAREMALLDSVATPTVATAVTPPYQRQASTLAQPAQLPPVPPPIPAPVVEPVYATAPLIDWPASPPPGARAAPSAADKPPMPDVLPTDAREPDASPAPSPLPVRPQLPPRTSPPMVYPVAEFTATPANAPSIATPSPVSPLSIPPAPAASSRPPRPVGPPPGTAHPAFVPPTASRPFTPPSPVPESAPPIVRQLNPPTEEPQPPIVRELDVTTRDTPPPVVRELAVATHDETTTGTDGGTMNREAPAPTSVPPAPNAMKETAAMPTILPPPLPPMPATRSATPPAPMSNPPIPIMPSRPAQTDEMMKARAGFARVAVARQTGSKPTGPPPTQRPPQPSASPEPLQSPLPTGPRVHQCPTCGYPVRDHARYCPNCGSRQG